jgi:primosomal protein N' (replication factor Y) (superfamily II helicase)
MPVDRPEPAIANVLIGVAVDTAYSYRIPAQMTVDVGDFVNVPFGARQATGVVWEIGSSPPVAGSLKFITGKHDLPPLRRELRQLIDWVANWTLAPRGMVLRMAIRAPERAGPERPRVAVRLAGKLPERMTPARARVVEAAQGGLALSKAALAELAGCSVAVIDSLIDAGTLESLALPLEPVASEPRLDFATIELEPGQRSAADWLAQSVERREFSACLLEGVTGSGKTEVYFEAIAAALQCGRQALIMVPEIALTAQFLDRFARRFGVLPAEWHSAISAPKKARIWSGVAAGEVRVVAGARSALLLPFAALGLIVVDEEHDAAYKQEDGVSYHARDMAVVRARLERAAIILASATPSLETRVNAAQGRYHHLRLATRYGGRALPSVTMIDLRNETANRGRWISSPLASAIGETIDRRQQVLLFLNRRGYAPLTLCRQCGHRFQCPNCSAWLVEHRFRRALLCHHCGHLDLRPRNCPKCFAEDSLQACGPGIERLAEEVAGLFPEARTLVLSSDFPGGIERLKRELGAIEQGLFDIIIGTQLVAKGHHFPQLSLAAIIDADIGLSNGDPRAAERTFQLLAQVTGRAGRGTSAGRGLVQSWQPEHPVMQAIVSGDSERFYREEIAVRQRAGLPPFGRLAALIISANDRSLAQSYARTMVRVANDLPPSPRWRLSGELPGEGELVLLGPAEAPIAVVRGRHRFRLLVKAPRQADMQGFLRALLAQSPPTRGSLRVAVDVDPQSFL